MQNISKYNYFCTHELCSLVHQHHKIFQVTAQFSNTIHHYKSKVNAEKRRIFSNNFNDKKNFGQ